VDRDERIVRTLLARFPDAVAIYRYGSTVDGTERDDSDVDVALLGRTPLPERAVFDARIDLSDALGRDVDLVDVRRVPTTLRMQVITRGVRLQCSDELERGRFEDYVFASYARLNEERRGVLARIAVEGRILDG
jgi:predicted nucleotidyltransferase